MFTTENKKGGKKTLSAIIALALVAAIGVGGVMAYLTMALDDAVVNTFVAAGGGSLLDSDADTGNLPSELDGSLTDSVNPAFYLVETEVEYNSDTGAYEKVSAGTLVLANDYEKVSPSMTIVKDPQLTVDLSEGIDVYVFIKVVDTTEGNLIWAASDYWEELTDGSLSLSTNERLFVYKGSNANYSVTGTSDKELDAVSFLADDQVTSADTLSDTDAGTDGTMELGTLSFYAYACQASGFESATAAYAACFTE